MEIKCIADCLEHLETIACWHEQQWGTEWAAEVRRSIQRDSIPTIYVAFLDNVPVGTAMLTAEDMLTRPDISPWLAGIYTKPEFRHRGIASALAQYAMEQASRMGIRRLWLYTPNSRKLYERLGWTFINEQEYLGEIVTIMRHDFPSERT